MTTAPQKKRVAAMLIDLLPLTLAFFLVYFVLVDAVLEARHPDEKAAYDARIDQLDVATERADDLDKKPTTLKTTVDTLTEEGASPADIEAAEAEAEAARQEADDASDEADSDLRRRRRHPGRPVRNRRCSSIEGFFVFGLLYLVVPSALTGQTLGKKIMGIRVIRTDGSKLGWAGAFTRYGLIVGAANLLFMLLQVLARCDRADASCWAGCATRTSKACTTASPRRSSSKPDLESAELIDADPLDRCRRTCDARTEVRLRVRRGVEGAEVPARGQGREPRRDDESRAAGSARLHDLDRRVQGVHGRGRSASRPG